MKTAILGLVAAAASASPSVERVLLNQGNPIPINDATLLRGGRELGKREHKRERDNAVAVEESLVHAMEAEAALVDAVETETALVQKFAKAEKKLKKKDKAKRAKEKKDKKEHGVRSPPRILGEDRKKKREKNRNTPKGDAALSKIMSSKTSKPTATPAVQPAVTAPLAPENENDTKRGWLNTSSPSTMIPSFQPTISPTAEVEEKESSEPPSSAPITSAPTFSIITPVPTAAPITSAPVANGTATSLPTFMPSYSPTDGEEGDVEAVPVNSTFTLLTLAPVSSPPTSATSSVASAAVGDVVAVAPTTPSPTSSVVTAPPVNSTIPNDATDSVPDCPAAYDATKTTYVGGDESTVNEHIFQCQKGYEKYCNTPEWDDALLTGDANAKKLWDDAWMHIGPCVAVTSDEV